MSTPVPDGIPKSISLLQNTYFWSENGLSLGYDDGFESVGVRDTEMREISAYLTREGDKFLERLGYKKENGVYRVLQENEERIALFCHGAMGRAWIASLLHIPLHTMWASFHYTHTGVTVIRFRNNADGFTAPTCLVYDDMSHLYAAGAEHMTFNNKTLI